MATVKKSMKKAQEGAGVPKGKVQGEMTGKLYDKKAFMARKDSASADLQKAIGPKSKPAPKKKMKDGGSLKPVPADKKGSLGKLPTAVRNKMGFQKSGGKTKKASSMKMGGKCKYGC
jgi:hypothetical protein